jgi:hypothetical protein
MSLGKEIDFIESNEALLEYVRQDIVDEVYIDTFKNKEELDKLVQMFLDMGVTVHIGMGFLPENSSKNRKTAEISFRRIFILYL